MTTKKKRIQVSESIAEEVKLFAKLLELGEITSVYDFLKKLEQKSEVDFEGEYPNLYDVPTLEYFWAAVIQEIQPPTTQAIFAQQGRLISFNRKWALIELSSPQLARLTYSRIPKVEAAFEIVFGHKVTVQIVPRTKLANHVL